MTVPFPPQALDATALLKQRLGGDLLAVYLYGSFVDGGLRPHSDIDLLAIARRPLSETERAGTMAALLALSAPPGDPARRPLELTLLVLADVVPWRHPARRELQFGEWLRPQLSAGQVPAAERDPDLALLLTQARTRGVALAGPAPERLLPAVPDSDLRAAMAAMLPEVAQHWPGEEKHALLTLARMWITLCSGDIVPKDVAASRVGAQLPPEHRPALERARQVHLGAAGDDWRDWQPQVGRCIGYMSDTMQAWLRSPP
ncbi:DUF4111 domain-containing protein [Xanthomonas sp. AmX2]|uniref:aminoglycoside adenylyltransferase family protein n=1 Tax=Xanthomonas sp. TaxID=29446 RepID=UPI00197D87C9|nr:aminoglycoside adenylyltransferase family protein [Xanthomonas sp.]MBN6151511.1 DUF4111 domain-containing protein [Xanthomonas sp.]